jgi:hypothetical protein
VAEEADAEVVVVAGVLAEEEGVSAAAVVVSAVPVQALQ